MACLLRESVPPEYSPVSAARGVAERPTPGDAPNARHSRRCGSPTYEGDLSALTEITAATTEIVTATAVLSIWDLAAADLARTWDDPTNRMVLGVGVSIRRWRRQAVTVIRCPCSRITLTLSRRVDRSRSRA